MGVGEIRQGLEAATGYTVTLTLTVEDARALWAAAADRALAAPGTTLADVLDTIGPREDPSIADCIAMLTAPAALPGCALDAYEVAEAGDELPPMRIIQLPTQPILRAAHAGSRIRFEDRERGPLGPVLLFGPVRGPKEKRAGGGSGPLG